MTIVTRSGVIIISAWKLSIVAGSAIGVWVYSLNPTDIVVAAIVSFPGIVTAIIAALTYHNNAKNHAATMVVMNEVKKTTDGMMSAKVAEVAQLTTDKDEQAVQLSETAQKLAHVEGHEEGRQAGVASEIDREPPKEK